jgi:hypothetical protein
LAYPGAERESIPAQVSRNPSVELKVRFAELAVEPDSGDLSNWKAVPASLGGQLETQFETVMAFDADPTHEVGRICFEVVGRIAGSDPSEEVERPPRAPRK